MKIVLIIQSVVIGLFIFFITLWFSEQDEIIKNLTNQSELQKIEIKYLKGLTADKAEQKQEDLEEEVSIVKTRSIIP